MPNIGFEIIYPPGCKDLSGELRKDELRRRLNDLSTALDKIIEEESCTFEHTFDEDSISEATGHSNFKGLFMLLTSPEYTMHSDLDIQMRVAVCICKIMKIFCPSNPFAGISDSKRLTKSTLIFIISCISHLSKLKDKGDILYPKLHSILYICCQIDLLLWCATLEDETLLLECIRTIFSIVRNINIWAWTEPSIIRQMVLDMTVKVLLHAEKFMPASVICFILELLIDPARTHQPEQHSFSRDVILRTAVHLEYHIQMLLQNALLSGVKEDCNKTTPLPSSNILASDSACVTKAVDAEADDDNAVANIRRTSVFGEHIFLIIYALHTIQDSLISPILPTIELKVKSPFVRERKRAFRLLARLFSEPNSLLHEKNKSLWESFLGRFNDIDKDVRKLCVHMVPQLLKSNTYLPHDHVLSAIIQRAHDPDEDVRLLVMNTISKMASESCDSITDEMFDLLKERTRDKTLSIRKEAAVALGTIYRRSLQAEKLLTDRLAAILNTILHMYYNASVEDRIATERLFKSCIVPYHFDVRERVRALFTCYSLVDDISIRTVQEMFKIQYAAMSLVRDVLHRLADLQENKISRQVDVELMDKLHLLSALLPKSEKSVEHLKRLFNQAHTDRSLRSQLGRLTRPICTCSQATIIMRELLKKVNVGNTSTTSESNLSYARSIKILLERTAPVLMDKAFGLELLTQLVIIRESSTVGSSGRLGTLSIIRSLRLLFALAVYFKEILPVDEVLDYVISVLTDESESETTISLPGLKESSNTISTEADPRDAAQELALNILCCLFGSPRISVNRSTKGQYSEPDMQPAYKDQRQRSSSSLTLQLTERVVELLPLLQNYCCTGLTRNYPPVLPLSKAEPVKRLDRGRAQATKRHTTPEVAPSNAGSTTAVSRAGAAWSCEKQRAKLAVRLLLCLRNATTPQLSPPGKQNQKQGAVTPVIPSVDLDEEGGEQEENGQKGDDEEDEEQDGNTEFLTIVRGRIQRALDSVVEICLACDPDSPDYVTCLTSLSRIGLQLPGVYNEQIKTYITRCLVPQVLGRQDSNGEQQTANGGDSDTSTGSTKSRLLRLAEWLPDGAISRGTRAKMAAIKLMVNWLRGLKNEVKPVAQAVIRLLHRVIIHDGDLTRQGKICPGDMSRMRLVAASAWLKLAHSQAYVDNIEVGWYQSMTYVVCDPCPQVRSHFLIKLNKGLYRLHLPLEYMAMFAHASDVQDAGFRQRAKQLLIGNIQRRREFLNRHPAYLNDAKFLFGLLPDYVLPYLIYLLAHDPEWSIVSDAAHLNRIKNSLWFVMEPILARGHNFSFLRKIIERIKHVRDALAPDDTVANTKLYTTCDIALGLLLTRCPTLTIKEYPVDIKLPKALFIPAPSDFSNPDFSQLLSIPNSGDHANCDKEQTAEKALLQFTPVKHGRALKDGLMPPQLLKVKSKAPVTVGKEETKRKRTPVEIQTADKKDETEHMPTEVMIRPKVIRKTAHIRQARLVEADRQENIPSLAATTHDKGRKALTRGQLSATTSDSECASSSMSCNVVSPKKRTRTVTGTSGSDSNSSPVNRRKRARPDNRGTVQKQEPFSPPASTPPKRKKADSLHLQRNNSTSKEPIAKTVKLKQAKLKSSTDKKPMNSNVRITSMAGTRKSAVLKSKSVSPGKVAHKCSVKRNSMSATSTASSRTSISNRSPSRSSTSLRRRCPARSSGVTATMKLNSSKTAVTQRK